MLTVAISRTSLSLADLTIGDYPGTLWLPNDGLERPAMTWVRQTASSPFTHGTVTTRAKLDQSSIPLTIKAKATTTALLVAAMDEVEAAFSQLAYTVTITLDGQSKAYVCDPADVAWGQVDSGMSKAFMAQATVSIPCHPVAGASGASTALYVVAPTVPLP